MPDIVRRLMAEFLGTFGLVFIGGLAIFSAIAASGGQPGAANLLVIALGFGLALLGALYAFGEACGGHFNPAVTLAALLDGRINVIAFGSYLVAQVIGGVVAGLALLAVSGQDEVAATATVPGQGVSASEAFLLEVLLTAIFVAVILRVTTSGTMGPSAFLGIPLTLAVIHLAAVPFSGASVNPARSLGSAIVGDNYTDIWIYVTAPFVGAIIGWVLYSLVSAGRLGVPALGRRNG